MASCVACGAELEPPVRIPHTVYVKTLYRIGGQDYCRHHIIKDVVVAGVITEVKACQFSWSLGRRFSRTSSHPGSAVN